MKKWLAHARQQPEYKRNAIALSSALSITAVILIVWLTTIPGRFSGEKESVIVVEKASPFSDIKDNLAATFESISKVWEDLSLKVQELTN